jgi:hypothetical protein
MSENMHPFYFFPLRETERLIRRLWILDFLPNNAVGAEIGVFRGHFAEFILERKKPKKLFLVDPWTKLGPDFTQLMSNNDYSSGGKLTTKAARDEVIGRIERFKQTDTVIIEDFCAPFLQNLYERIQIKKEQYLDFVYLDAGHGYKDVFQGLTLSDKVLSKEGVIAGDDWTSDPSDRFYGVCRAVNDFCKKHDYQIIAAGDASQYAIRRTLQPTRK